MWVKPVRFPVLPPSHLYRSTSVLYGRYSDNMPATSRLLHLLSMLQTRRAWPGSVLADRLGVSQRTVRRDVDRLRDLGYNVHAAQGPDGGYRLESGSALPPLLFDDEQVIAIAIALRSAPTTGAGIEEAAERALITVQQVLPSRLRHRINTLQFTTTSSRLGEGPSSIVPVEVLTGISEAIRSTEILRFAYSGAAPITSHNEATPDSQPLLRRVEPHHLVASGGHWYLIAWDLERDDWRSFRADRITLRSSTGPRFTPRTVPGGSATEFLRSRFAGTVPGEKWPCVGKVLLHAAAHEVLPFAGDGVVEAVGPNRTSFEVGSWSWIALAASLNRFDTGLEVIDPPELRDAFAVLARRNAASADPRAMEA